MFINSVYVYEDKIIITFNYKDGEKNIDFSETEKIAKKKNSDNSNDYQSSSLKVNGGANRYKCELFAMGGVWGVVIVFE